MVYRILLVDDDELIADSIRRRLYQQSRYANPSCADSDKRSQDRLDVHISHTGEAALKRMAADGEFSVILTDWKMPGMDGLSLLKEAQKLSPTTTQILLTGFADVKMAVALVNECHPFRFLLKPCSIDLITEAIDRGIEQHEIDRKKRDAAQQSLSGSIQLLTEIIGLLDPLGAAELARIRDLILSFERRLKLGDKKIELDLAAMLGPIGAAVIPAPLIIKWRANQVLSDAERTLIERIPEQSSRMLASIPRLEGVARLVRYQSKGFDGTGTPTDDLKGDAIPLGARILKIVQDFVHLEGTGMDAEEVLRRMKDNEEQYDPMLFRMLFNVIYTEASTKRKASTHSPSVERLALHFPELKLGDVLIGAVETADKVLLTAPGAVVTDSILQKLKNYREFVGLKEPIRILRKSAALSETTTVLFSDATA